MRPQEVIGFGDRPQEVIGFGDLWGPSGTSGDHLGTIWEIDSMKLSVHYGSGPSGVRGSIRLVERLPKVIFTSNKIHEKNKYRKRVGKRSKTSKTGIA